MSALKRKKPLRNRSGSIRALRDDEPMPAGTPRRYRNDSGYVRLRWKISPEQYVEAYEHRVVMGRPEGMHVHHINGMKDDNRPANLQVLSPHEHAKLHQDQAREVDPERGCRFGGYKNRDLWEKAQRKQARQEERRELGWEMKKLYEAGGPTTAIAEQYGTTPTRVTALLRLVGVKIRTTGESRARVSPRYNTPEAVAVIADLRMGRVKIAQAAREIGCDPVALRKRVWTQVKRDVFERDGGRCVRCGGEGQDAHHRATRGSSGPQEPLILFGMANVVTLCRGCHDWVGEYPAEARETGLAVRRLAVTDPADVLVLYAGGVWARLDHVGGWSAETSPTPAGT